MKREKFGTRLGFILISAGCAIGLGNVWRFPYITGQYGGAAFVLIYLVCLVMLGLPIMIMEFSVGRAAGCSIARAFDKLEPLGTKWHWYKWFGIAGNYLLMMFYTTIGGWMLLYFVKMLAGEFEGLDTKRCIAPLNAVGARNISVTGGGTIDGNGDSWRQVKRSKMTSGQWKKLLASGGFTDEKGDIWYPDSSSYRGSLVSDAFNVPQGMETDSDWESVKTYLRPVLLEFRDCENVLLEDCLFQNSPCWNLHPLMCRNVIIKNITVRNPWYSQNGDGLDVDSCENVLVLDSDFDVGDDAICIKSGKDEDGRLRARPCRNLIVRNCTVFHGHGGFVVGSEMSGGVQNISVRDCRFFGTDVGLRFKSCRGRGGVVENIHIKDIVMTDIPTEPLLFDLHYGGKSAVEAAEDGASPFDIEPVPAGETTPEFRDIHISDIFCKGAARAMYFNGIPEMPINGITVEDCMIVSDLGADIRYSEDVVLENVRIRHGDGPAYVFANCGEVRMSGCQGGDVDGGRGIFRHNSDKVTVE